MIPKVIHYCWFGNGEKSDLIKKCIASWREKCPDWEIKEWNETNFNVHEMPYMEEAYQLKKWAFVTDVARLLIIYRHGGVYLDTDVELRESIDDWLNHDAFFAWESNRNISSGVGFGAIKEHNAIRAMIEYYKNKHFCINGRMKIDTCPAINTEALFSEYSEFKRNGKTQKSKEIILLSYSEYSLKAIHHGTATWVDGEISKREYKDSKLKDYLRDYRKFEFIDKYLGKKISNIYTFLVYDLIENGYGYYLKRMIGKIRNGR